MLSDLIPDIPDFEFPDIEIPGFEDFEDFLENIDSFFDDFDFDDLPDFEEPPIFTPAELIDPATFGAVLGTDDDAAIADFLTAPSFPFTIDDVTVTGAEGALIGLADGFEILPLGGGDPVVEIGRALFLTTGGVPGTENTAPGFSVELGTPGDERLDEIAQDAFPGAGETFDATIVEFTFDVPAGFASGGVVFDVIFGSDEFPEFSNTDFIDIASVDVNGVNYALFNSNAEQPLSVIDQNLSAGNFIDNSGFLPDGPSAPLFATEYDGFSSLLTIRAPVVEGENTVRIGIADTGDAVYDSGVFIGNLRSTTSRAGGTFVPVGGTDGDDRFEGDASPEDIDGGDGDDVILPGLGADLIALGEGVDSVIGSAGDFFGDVISDFSFDDIIELEGSVAVNGVTVVEGQATIALDSNGDGVADGELDLEGDFEEDDIVFEEVDGVLRITRTDSDGNVVEVIAEVTLSGTVDADRILGTEASESIEGDDGDDRVIGGGGLDTLDGGAGDDVLIDRDGATSVVGGAGLDRVVTGDGDDAVDGGDDRDVVKTSAGDDTVDLGAGDDVVLSGTGDDVIFGGDGNDVIKTSDGDDVVEGGAGDDVVLAGTGIDTAFGGAGDDVIKSGRNVPLGAEDDGRLELMDGGEGDDTLVGFRGGESMVGGEGNDTLLGGLGDDIAEGGIGDDRFALGPGRDTLVYNTVDFGEDRVIDFAVGSDRIDFSGVASVDGLEDLTITQVGSQTVITVDGGDGRLVLGNVENLIGNEEDVFVF